MSNDKMREEFEACAKAEQGLDLTRLPHGGYRSFATHQAWWAYQASRAVLVVELPKPCAAPLSYTDILVYGEVVKAIETAGVRVKP